MSYLLFCRRWMWMTEAFPLHEFDNVPDSLLRERLDAVAHDLIMTKHGSVENFRKIVQEEEEQKPRRRRQSRQAFRERPPRGLFEEAYKKERWIRIPRGRIRGVDREEYFVRDLS